MNAVDLDAWAHGRLVLAVEERIISATLLAEFDARRAELSSLPSNVRVPAMLTHLGKALGADADATATLIATFTSLSSAARDSAFRQLLEIWLKERAQGQRRRQAGEREVMLSDRDPAEGHATLD